MEISRKTEITELMDERLQVVSTTKEISLFINIGYGGFLLKENGRVFEWRDGDECSFEQSGWSEVVYDPPQEVMEIAENLFPGFKERRASLPY